MIDRREFHAALLSNTVTRDGALPRDGTGVQIMQQPVPEVISTDGTLSCFMLPVECANNKTENGKEIKHPFSGQVWVSKASPSSSLSRSRSQPGASRSPSRSAGSPAPISLRLKGEEGSFEIEEVQDEEEEGSAFNMSQIFR